MDRFLKQKLWRAPAVVHGGIYNFKNANGYEGKCIVIAASYRSLDKYVSAIFLTEANDDFKKHNDVVEIILPDGSNWICHCGMITYIRRDRIGDMISEVTSNQLKSIKNCIKQELAIGIDENNYKQLYYSLINKIASWNKGDNVND